MPFTVEDFHDLTALLEERPDWRSELRRLLLTDQVLGLPALVQQLVEAQQRAEARLEGVEDRLARVEARLEGVEDRLARVEARLEGVEDRLARVEARLEGVEDRLARLEVAVTALVETQTRNETRLERLETKVGSLQGHDLERRFRERADAYLGRLIRRVHVLTGDELAALVEDAVDDGRISDAERADLFAADVIARGRRPGDGTEVYAVGQVSVGVGAEDVRRAVQRAAILSKLRPALPFVGGEHVTPRARSLAAALGAWQVTNGHVVPPRP